MAFVRIYTGADGMSRFEDMDLPFHPSSPEAAGSFIVKTSQVEFRRQPPGFLQDWHPAPRRQYVVTLEGTAELEAGNGEKRKFGPSDILLAEDLTGSGHVTRVTGKKPRISIAIPAQD